MPWVTSYSCATHSNKTSAKAADQNVRDRAAFFFLLARIVVECPATSEVESAPKTKRRLLKSL